MFLLLTACTSKTTEDKIIELPTNIPDFVQLNDFEKIDWERKAVKFGERGIIGNENISGVIGADLPSYNHAQKWMWHLWGIDEAELTIVGFHKDTQKVERIVIDGWQEIARGENNGADAHAVSSVQFPEKGEWAVLLYTDGELFDVLVFDIKE